MRYRYPGTVRYSNVEYTLRLAQRISDLLTRKYIYDGWFVASGVDTDETGIYVYVMIRAGYAAPSLPSVIYGVPIKIVVEEQVAQPWWGYPYLPYFWGRRRRQPPRPRPPRPPYPWPRPAPRPGPRPPVAPPAPPPPPPAPPAPPGDSLTGLGRAVRDVLFRRRR